MASYNFKYVKESSRSELVYLTSKDLFSVQPLRCEEYYDAYVVPADFNDAHFHRGVLTCEGVIIQNSLLFEGFEDNWNANVEMACAQKKEEEVVYLGWLEPVWGHILTDCLKKLWFLRTPECKELLSNGVKLVAVMPWDSKALDDIFDMLDIPIGSIENVNVLTQYKKVYVPDNSFVTLDDESRQYTQEYVNEVNRIISKIPQTTSTGKLYFTRTAFSKSSFLNRRETGESIIENVFRKLGYTIISPEKMSVFETLSLIRNCDAFASTEGSVSHNILFCKKNTDVTIIRKVDYTNRWQLAINQIANINVTYIDAHQSIISHGCLGPFYMCVTRQLEDYYGKYIFHIPHWCKLSFWWYLIQNRRIVRFIIEKLHI